MTVLLRLGTTPAGTLTQMTQRTLYRSARYSSRAKLGWQRKKCKDFSLCDSHLHLSSNYWSSSICYFFLLIIIQLSFNYFSIESNWKFLPKCRINFKYYTWHGWLTEWTGREWSRVRQTKNMVKPHPTDANILWRPYWSAFSLPNKLRTAVSASVMLGQQKNSPIIMRRRKRKKTLRMSFSWKMV